MHCDMTIRVSIHMMEYRYFERFNSDSHLLIASSLHPFIQCTNCHFESAFLIG